MIEFDCNLQRGSFTLRAAFTGGCGITALTGPSGSGKSTVLALIAGLVRPSQGHITINRRVLTDSERGLFVPRHKRRTGLVYQDAQLFPHLSVHQNLLFGRWFAPKTVRMAPFGTVVEVLGISHLLDRRPPGLSGGEKQRVALARALLSQPELLALDEPLASLDAARRDDSLALIERVRDEFQIPMVYVTHAASEVVRLAEHVVVLDNGGVAWTGAPQGFVARLKNENASVRLTASPSP